MSWGTLTGRVGAFLVVAALGAGLVAGQAPRLEPRQRPTRDEATYLRWLEERSMLAQARRSALGVSGRGVQWRHPYGRPQPRAAVRQASVWLLDYPGSVVTRPGESVIAHWGDPRLWDALHDIGIDLLHTGPIYRAGGVEGTEYTPTQDGWFDRISLDIDPTLGSEKDYARMVAVAGRRGGTLGGDLVPLHT